MPEACIPALYHEAVVGRSGRECSRQVRKEPRVFLRLSLTSQCPALFVKPGLGGPGRW